MAEDVDPDRGAALDRMTDAFFALDADRRFTYLNERGRDIICEAIGEDHTIEELRGRHIWEEIPEAVDTPFYENYERALETGETVAFESPYEPLSTWFEVRAYPSESGLSVYFRDVSDRKRRERRLQRQARQFEGFGRILSHDLKNPLNVARSRLEMARERDAEEDLDAIEDALHRVETLVDDLTTAMDEGALVTAVSAVDFAAVGRAAWTTAATGEATLEVEDTARIRADENALTRLLENLFRNAIEHGGRDVTVRLGPLPDGFYVADDGPGIPPDDREDIFEPGVSTKDEGTGLGMASVRQIALAHGWDLRVAESRDGGTRFECTDVEVV